MLAEYPAFEVLPSLWRLRQHVIAANRGQYDAIFMLGRSMLKIFFFYILKDFVHSSSCSRNLLRLGTKLGRLPLFFSFLSPYRGHNKGCHRPSFYKILEWIRYSISAHLFCPVPSLTDLLFAHIMQWKYYFQHWFSRSSAIYLWWRRVQGCLLIWYVF